MSARTRKPESEAICHRVKESAIALVDTTEEVFGASRPTPTSDCRDKRILNQAARRNSRQQGACLMRRSLVVP